MKNRESNKNRIKPFLSSLYTKLFRINDTPQRVALGFGLGVGAGILPGTGPVVAIFLALVLRANRAAALIGCLATNTWLSFLTFVLAIKVGSVLLGLKWQQVVSDWNIFLKDFHWLNLFKLSILKMALPAIIGFFVIAICLGALVYLITIIVILRLKYRQGRKSA